MGEKKRPAGGSKLVKQIKGISVGRGPCTFLPQLKCVDDLNGDVSKKKIVVVVSMVWFGNFLLTNPMYERRLRAAFDNTLASGRRVPDLYGPISRWAFAPRLEIESELEAQIPKRRSDSQGLPLSVCVQARWGLETEMIKIERCLDDLEKETWWPGNGIIFNVVTTSEEFRSNFSSRFAKRGIISSPKWPKITTIQEQELVAYKDMLALGRCDIAILENGGSTFSYLATSMYHSLALRDVYYEKVPGGPISMDCRNLHTKAYEKLYPDARSGIWKS